MVSKPNKEAGLVEWSVTPLLSSIEGQVVWGFDSRYRDQSADGIGEAEATADTVIFFLFGSHNGVCKRFNLRSLLDEVSPVSSCLLMKLGPWEAAGRRHWLMSGLVVDASPQRWRSTGQGIKDWAPPPHTDQPQTHSFAQS